jgi:hypothetical protein
MDTQGRRGDHETYRALVYVLCDQFMIAANPAKLSIRVNLDGNKYKIAEIQAAMIGYHIFVYDKYDNLTHRTFMQEIRQILNYFDELIRLQ